MSGPDNRLTPEDTLRVIRARFQAQENPLIPMPYKTHMRLHVRADSSARDGVRYAIEFTSGAITGWKRQSGVAYIHARNRMQVLRHEA